MKYDATIYTDGSFHGRSKDKLGGWGVLIQMRGKEYEFCGGEVQSSNNKMEMQAAIEALASLPYSIKSVELFSDSQYVIKGITEWITGWKARKWLTHEGLPVVNKDRWLILDALDEQLFVDWRWVKGHRGNSGNERADRLASRGVEELRSRLNI